MQRSSQQIERALERVKIIQKGSGSLVRPHLPISVYANSRLTPCKSTPDQSLQVQPLNATAHMQSVQARCMHMPAQGHLLLLSHN